MERLQQEWQRARRSLEETQQAQPMAAPPHHAFATPREAEPQQEGPSPTQRVVPTLAAAPARKSSVRAALRRALILGEVFGPPRALHDEESRW